MVRVSTVATAMFASCQVERMPLGHLLSNADLHALWCRSAQSCELDLRAPDVVATVRLRGILPP